MHLLFVAKQNVVLILAVDCGDPKQPSNGYFTLRGETPTFKTVATFTCNHWHYLKGSQFVICRADGQWNATSPECIRKFTLLDVSHRSSTGCL